jgi:hypothetical protein
LSPSGQRLQNDQYFMLGLRRSSIIGDLYLRSAGLNALALRATGARRRSEAVLRSSFATFETLWHWDVCAVARWSLTRIPVCVFQLQIAALADRNIFILLNETSVQVFLSCWRIIITHSFPALCQTAKDPSLELLVEHLTMSLLCEEMHPHPARIANVSFGPRREAFPPSEPSSHPFFLDLVRPVKLLLTYLSLNNFYVETICLYLAMRKWALPCHLNSI